MFTAKTTLLWGSAFLLIILLAWPYLFFHGQVPVDGNMVRMVYPNWTFARTCLQTHTSLVWNPFRNMGEPFLGDPQTMAVYPFQWVLLHFSLSFLNFIRLWVLLHSFLAIFFIWQLVWYWFRDPWAAAMACLIIGLNGFFLSRGSLMNHFASAAYLPMVLYFMERRRPGLLGMALGLQWLAGFPPFSLLTGLMAFVFASLRGREGLRTWFWGSFIGIGLAAIQVLPFVELFLHSSRQLMLSGTAAVQYSQPLKQLAKIWLLPQWFAFFPNVEGDQAIVSSYVGLIPLSLAWMGVLRGRKVEKMLGFIFAASLILSLGLFLPFYRHLGFLHIFRFPANWLFLGVACIALLAAAGVSFMRSSRWKTILVGVALVDLIGFSQYVRVSWLSPQLLGSTPPLALNLLSQFPSTRLYHPPSVENLYSTQEWKGLEDLTFLKESLLPSHAMAFGIREVDSYQVMSLRSADAYKRRLFAGGFRSPLARWAGISTVVTQRRGATRFGPESIAVVHLSPERRVFFREGQEGDVMSPIVEGPGRCEVDVTCSRRNCFVIFAEMNYPGWQLSIDGVRQTPAQFENAFLAASVPPGRHHVEFRIRSRSVLLGSVMSVCTLIWLFVSAIFRRVDRNKASVPSGAITSK